MNIFLEKNNTKIILWYNLKISNGVDWCISYKTVFMVLPKDIVDCFETLEIV